MFVELAADDQSHRSRSPAEQGADALLNVAEAGLPGEAGPRCLFPLQGFAQRHVHLPATLRGLIRSWARRPLARADVVEAQGEQTAQPSLASAEVCLHPLEKLLPAYAAC